MIIQEGQSDGLLLPISHSCLALDVSRSGYYDNAFAESFIKTLKVEEIYLNEYETFEDAFRNI